MYLTPVTLMGVVLVHPSGLVEVTLKRFTPVPMLTEVGVPKSVPRLVLKTLVRPAKPLRLVRSSVAPTHSDRLMGLTTNASTPVTLMGVVLVHPSGLVEVTLKRLTPVPMLTEVGVPSSVPRLVLKTLVRPAKPLRLVRSSVAPTHSDRLMGLTTRGASTPVTLIGVVLVHPSGLVEVTLKRFTPVPMLTEVGVPSSVPRLVLKTLVRPAKPLRAGEV